MIDKVVIEMIIDYLEKYSVNFYGFKSELEKCIFVSLIFNSAFFIFFILIQQIVLIFFISVFDSAVLCQVFPIFVRNLLSSYPLPFWDNWTLQKKGKAKPIYLKGPWIIVSFGWAYLKKFYKFTTNKYFVAKCIVHKYPVNRNKINRTIINMSIVQDNVTLFLSNYYFRCSTEIF